MILGSRAELAGRVKLQISGGARGTIDYPWQDNMILDRGFVQLITSKSVTSTIAFTYFSVGSSSQPVAATDTGLIAPVARISGGRVTHGWNAVGGYGWSRGVKSFNRGEAAGNISELATSSANNNTSALARALVRDSLGNPTTITVLSDEVLTVTWEWRKWWTVSQPNTIEYLVDGVPRTTTVSYKPLSEISKGDVGLGTGGILPIGASLISSAGGEFVGEYVNTFAEGIGNPTRKASTRGDNNSGSFGFGGALLPFDNEYATFDPPIAKTNEFKLEIRHRVALTRREP